jgi:hypothetical protein
MTQGDFASFDPWGHVSKRTRPSAIASAMQKETERALQTFDVLPDGPIRCNNRDGFTRVAVAIPLSRDLFDQLMNSESGYRAHYAASIECGEAFNQALIDAVAPLIIQAEHLYVDRFDRAYCEKSLLGSFSKFWYPKSLSDKSAESHLLRFKEELLVPAWRDHWNGKPRPRKGLLAPMPDEPAVLLNGTFVNEAGHEYEQKPGRSLQLHAEGWT